ncbi:MAG: gliding motility lipoprotein GldD [Bacteroidetes bacterium]|nr:gliding motility lipoprotein GldD [Bacteroidota bacterium]
MKYTSFLKISLFLFLSACNDSYTPRPEGYFKIDFPEKSYQQFDMPGYPYQFEYPSYGRIVKDSSFFGDTPENPWWINIFFPQFNATLYISYKEIGKYSLEKLLNDAFNLTNKHAVRASYIDDSLMETPRHIHGIFFKVSGEVATANQFFLTDSTKHFLRGALYFNVTPNQDSLMPVNTFLMQDVRHLINTFQWK